MIVNTEYIFLNVWKLSRLLKNLIGYFLMKHFFSMGPSIWERVNFSVFEWRCVSHGIFESHSTLWMCCPVALSSLWFLVRSQLLAQFISNYIVNSHLPPQNNYGVEENWPQMSHLTASALRIPQLVIKMKYLSGVHKTYLIVLMLQFKGENNWFFK